MGVKNFFKKTAALIFDIDSTELPEEQCRVLEDFVARHKFDISGKDSKEALEMLRKKHLVDSICVAKLNGSSLASCGANNGEAITGTAMFKYISSEIPASEAVLVKSKDAWLMLYPYKQKMYIIKAPSDISTVELKALANETEEMLKKKKGK